MTARCDVCGKTEELIMVEAGFLVLFLCKLRCAPVIMQCVRQYMPQA